jgi:CheY-like chemotaxis protein
MSDNLEPAIRLAAVGAGASDCIRKPINDDELGLVLRTRNAAHSERGVVAQ